MTTPDMPKYGDLILPAIRAVHELGGSATTKEMTEYVLDRIDDADELLAVTYPNSPNESVLVNRVGFGRSYAKLIGAVETPSRGTYLLTPLGKQLLELDRSDPAAAHQQILELDREYRRTRPRPKRPAPAPGMQENENNQDETFDEEDESTDAAAGRWPDVLLSRLHRLSPAGFEQFVLYLLREYGLELHRVGGSGDEGVDGIGTAPISPVLSSRVAVQVKRYDPNGRPIGRDVVALFQRDAQTKGAERAILVTLGRFTEAARKAATVTSPTVDLIDGTRVAELVLDKEIGVTLAPMVDDDWFDRFDN